MSPNAALARLDSLSPRGMKLGLAAIDALCQRLGRPERSAPSVLIAGTNGKGSTAATLASIATSCGLRAGLYTSPHLIEVTERIRVEGEDIASEELEAALARVFQAADAAPEIPATYFEALTAAAFLVFAQKGVDLAVLEVGLGGRLDATNVAPASLAVVTSIGLDHTSELGSSLPSIAREKAGIFRPGRPAVARARAEEAVQALRECCTAAGALWHDATREIFVRVGEVGLRGTAFEVATPERRISLRTPLPGAHQAWNTALALRAAELLPELFGTIHAERIVRGVAAVRWPGRLESFPAGHRTILLDGCHNAEGAASLADFLEQTGLSGRCPLVFGAMADKDVEAIAAALFGSVTRVRLVAAPSPRAASAADLLRRVGPAAPRAEACPSLAAALRPLLAERDAAPIIVAGSLYLIGETRAQLLVGVFEEELA